MEGKPFVASMVTNPKGEERFRILIFEGKIFKVEIIVFVQRFFQNLIYSVDFLLGKWIYCSVFVHTVHTVRLAVFDLFHKILLFT